MQGSCRNLLVALALTTVGVAAFFLFLYLTGHDPDDSPLTLKEWMIAGVLIGPGFGYLMKWRRARRVGCRAQRSRPSMSNSSQPLSCDAASSGSSRFAFVVLARFLRDFFNFAS